MPEAFGTKQKIRPKEKTRGGLTIVCQRPQGSLTPQSGRAKPAQVNRIRQLGKGKWLFIRDGLSIPGDGPIWQ